MIRKIASVLSMLALTAVLAFAAPTALTVSLLKVNNYAVQAGDLTLTPVACDAVNGNSYQASGTEILFVQNTDTSPHTFTVNSVPDAYGRTDTSLAAYSVASAGLAVIQMKQMQGWAGSGQIVTLTCSSNLLKFSVLRTN
jgi:hypothetical protein